VLEQLLLILLLFISPHARPPAEASRSSA